MLRRDEGRHLACRIVGKRYDQRADRDWRLGDHA
jgi:hypothetical protein